MTEENKENRVIQELRGTPIYCRSISPDQIKIVEKYIDAHTISGGHNLKKTKLSGKLTISGSSSIYLVMANLIKQEKQNNVNIIISDELYCDTPKIIKSFGCNTTEINVNKPDSILTLFQTIKNGGFGDKDSTNILFFESASNPNGNIFPFDIIPKLRLLSKKLYVVVDNTWLTHIIFNPFKYDVDIVVNSCSKYYSAGQCISGMIISKHTQFMNSLESFSKIMGYHVSVDYCKLLLENFDSLSDRLVKSHKNTIELTKVLKSYSLNIRNSSNPDDPSHQLALKYYNNVSVDDNQIIHPSVINVFLNKPIGLVKQLLFDNNIITQTSFGASHTKVCNFIHSVTPTSTQIRISVGYGPIDLEMFSFLKEN
ncbi:hypothetical protein RB653_006535 [Dictyostelium firmibasis]|uniref:Uncharacterized protein n=1 Tax=Dictyostelium firmibasis TaxID=79012 RepID=A0AAN7Z239_9MYCE